MLSKTLCVHVRELWLDVGKSVAFLFRYLTVDPLKLRV